MLVEVLLDAVKIGKILIQPPQYRTQSLDTVGNIAHHFQLRKVDIIDFR